MLFQPTNITPDVINGIGNGTIDTSDGLTVSWQINGNSPMVAYQIIIYANDASSTQKYDTTKVTLTNPVYGVDAKGNKQIFTATKITSSQLSTAGISNGNQYKLMIRQYYTSNDYIDQRSMSVFNTRAKPSVSITLTDANGNALSDNTLPTRSVSATGSYSQAQGDAIEWLQWNINAIVSVGGETTPVSIYDSGKIYGTGDLSVSYDSFVEGQDYEIVLTIETTNGVVATATETFTTDWSAQELSAETKVCKLNGQSTGMRVLWGGFSNIKGTASGNYSISNGTLTLPAGSSVTWDEQNGTSLSIATPWAAIIQCQLQKVDVDPLMRIKCGSDTLKVYYSLSARKIYMNYSGGTTRLPASDATVDYEGTVTIIITPSKWYVRSDYLGGGLVPNTGTTYGLQPSETLVPQTGTTWMTVRENSNLSYTQYAITEVKISGNMKVNYIQVLSGYTSDELDELVAKAYTSADGYEPMNGVIGSPNFMTTFTENTLDAGTLVVSGSSIEGWSVYRRKETDPVSIHLADISDDSFRLIDYGCGSLDGMYHYEIYPIGNKKYLTDAIVTKSFNPCFENWSVLETEYDSDNDCYIVKNEYIFGKNLSSNSVNNNNTPTVYKNFTQYPTVLKSTSNYQSGTLSSLIGFIGYVSYIVQPDDTLEYIANRFNTTVADIIASNSNMNSTTELQAGMSIVVELVGETNRYFDDMKLRDAIWNLSMTTNPLFLKSRKGDVIEISTSQDVSMTYMDNTSRQATSVSFPWVQIDDAKDKRILGRYKPYSV